MSNLAALRSWLIALALTVLAVAVCIVYVDRPVADFVEGHVRHTEFCNWLMFAIRSLDLVVLGALFFLFACGLWVISGRELRNWAETPLLCSWSAMWAVAADIIFKHIFGRGWPDPTYIHDHLYGFHLLDGSTHWDSFPSGTAAISVAIVSVLWIRNPRWRVPGMLIVFLLSVAVVIANYHWLSDVIAGAFLGATTGWFTARLHPASRSTAG